MKIKIKNVLSKNRRILFAGALLLVLGTMAWFVFASQPPEPSYQGIKLSDWLAGYPPAFHSRSTFPAPIDEAVRNMGTNCIPLLLRELGAQDSHLKRQVLRIPVLHTFFKVPWIPSDVRNDR